MANPADMTDEELDKAIEGVEPEEPETPAAESPAEETEAQEQETEETPEPEAEEPEAKEEEEKPSEPSRREQLRVQQLLQKYGPPKERPAPSQAPQMDYQQALDADPELIQQLEADRQATGQAQYNAGLEQAKNIQFHTRLELDAPQVEAKYKFLNPRDKENFDPVRADAMNALFLYQTGYDPGDPQRGIPESVANPNIRYRDFVEAQMEFAEALLADRQVQSSKNIAKQAAATGLRPDGSSAKALNLNKPAHQMTDEELDAKIAQNLG